MNSSPLAILLIIAISAAAFGGIIFFGLKTGTTPTLPSPVTIGTTMRIPDILNLPGFNGNRQNQQPAPVQAPSSAPGHDIVVEKNELPSPAIPPAPAPSRLPRPNIQIPAPSRISTPIFMPTPQQPQPSPQPMPAPAPTPLPQTATAASFSVFSVSPQLKAFREQMVREGIIGDRDFTAINNNKDAEAFMLKLVEWQARKSGSSEAQVQDALDRIRKAYNQVRTTIK